MSKFYNEYDECTVWVNGTDVTDGFVSKSTAVALQFAFKKMGYEDVSIEEVD